jgi:hypothetical protein
MKYTELIKVTDDILKPLGFARKGACWNRKGDVVEVVDLQLSKAKDAVTLNIGVAAPDIYWWVWDVEMPQFVDETSCTVRTRIGELCGGHDKWWPLDFADTEEDVRRAVEAIALPFLAGMHSLAAMEEWLLKTNVVAKRYPPPILALTAIKMKLNKDAEALEVLSRLHQKPLGDWKGRVSTLEAKITKYRQGAKYNGRPS